MMSKKKDIEVFLKEESFCLMPWIHLHTGLNGKAQACCVSNIPYGNINEDALSNIWNSSGAKNFRKNILHKKKDNRCSYCHKVEAAGKKSIRQETILKYKEHLNLIEDTRADGSVNSIHPIYLDIRFSNVCNFRCRTCWHGASSSWFKEAQLLNTAASNQALIQNVDSFTSFKQNFEPYIHSLESLYFAGGEPLVTPEHYAFLNWLIEIKHTNIELRYNTNMSILTFKENNLVQLWTQFRSVEVMFSVEDTGARGEYIRKEMNWTVVAQNLTTLQHALPQLKLIWSPTVSVFNILRLPEVYLNFISKGWIQFDHINLNFLDRPMHYNAKIIEGSLLTEVEKKYKNLEELLLKEKVDQETIALWRSVVVFAQEKVSDKQRRKFKDIANRLDKMRKESFEVVFPELKDHF